MEELMPKKLEHALSPRKVQTAGPGRHCDGGGLYLQVIKKSRDDEGRTRYNRSWVFRYRLNGRLREMGLGPLSTLSLSEARERARTMRMKRLDGIDPIDERRDERQRVQSERAKLMTFEQVKLQFFKPDEGTTTRHIVQRQKQIDKYATPILGKMLVRDIDTPHISKVLDPIWYKIPELANRLRRRIENILDFAKVKGYRTGDNPARWEGHLDHIYKSRSEAQQAKRERAGRSEHHAALPFAEVPNFMKQLREKSGSSARALEFCILTAMRTSEIRKAAWEEIDFDAKVWSIPGPRMKMKRPHRVPLCDRAMVILREMQAIRQNDLVFSGDGEDGLLSHMTILTRLRTIRGDVTTHGFRSSFKDWAAETTNFPNIMSEMALAHKIADGTEAAYRRGELLEKRKLLMQAWDKFCTSPPPEGKVVSIAKKHLRERDLRRT
jgi:integrase